MSKAQTQRLVAMVAQRSFGYRNDSLRGIEGISGTGRLPETWRNEYHADREKITYTVHSYATPIAWVLADGEVVIPAVKYSVTTSRHQNEARTALADGDYRSTPRT